MQEIITKAEELYEDASQCASLTIISSAQIRHSVSSRWQLWEVPGDVRNNHSISAEHVAANNTTQHLENKRSEKGVSADQLESASLNLTRALICTCDKCCVIFDDSSALILRLRLLSRNSTVPTNDLHQHLMISHSITDPTHPWSAYEICRDQSTRGHGWCTFSEECWKAIAEGASLTAVTLRTCSRHQSDSVRKAESPQKDNDITITNAEYHLNHMPASFPCFPWNPESCLLLHALGNTAASILPTKQGKGVVALHTTEQLSLKAGKHEAIPSEG